MNSHFTRHPFVLLLALAPLAACGESQANGGGGPPASEIGSPAPGVTLPEGAQAVSFLGEPLFPPELPDDVRQVREEQLQEALANLEADPDGAEALIWAGRRYAYLGEYRQAIEVFTRGLELHPDDARFYRHRGHRYITVREPDQALADFRRAADLVQGTPDEVEPDGQPNAMGIPTSSLHFNIFYHYGLAHFIKGDFEAAEPIYRRCMEVSVHADSKVATAHWLYMTLRRLHRQEEADAFLDSLDLDALGEEIIESGSYLALLRVYKEAAGGSDPRLPETDSATLEGATFGYGVGNFHYYNGRTEAARQVFEGIVAARDQWAAFGYIAAEADLAQMEGLEGD